MSTSGSGPHTFSGFAFEHMGTNVCCVPLARPCSLREAGCEKAAGRFQKAEGRIQILRMERPRPQVLLAVARQ